MGDNSADFFWRMFYRVGFQLARCWWFLSRARHRGALIAIYVGTDVLLLRASYRSAWNFPGGGVRPAETPEQAAHRELLEETGLAVPELEFKRKIAGFWDGRRETIDFFELRLQKLPPLKIDNREIVEARLVAPQALRAMKLTGPVAAYLYGANT